MNKYYSPYLFLKFASLIRQANQCSFRLFVLHDIFLAALSSSKNVILKNVTKQQITSLVIFMNKKPQAE